MFYSQFILAKKGPLGTIWIAAHLERKLKKNQVADTDIGVSVDSILFPEVPIALRLSSHLLLGVVRIYSRKVNYLFHDCSEALLKVKQAFRSTAVDLPPEESTAPYHSITLPETFDLDDFELPDSALLHSDFDDRHVSTREQITLQDTLDRTGYSTSQFGLDERFGDGDVSQIGLDLDEELLLDNNLTLQDASVLDGAMHQGEGATDLTKMVIEEGHHGGHEDRKDESSKELSELLGGNWGKHVLPNVGNVHRNVDSSQRLIFNIQTPDLNEVFLPDDHDGGPSVVRDIDMDFNTADPPSPEFNQSANFPSAPGLLEEAIEVHSQELPASNPQNISPDTTTEIDKIDTPINQEVECTDVMNGPINAASASPKTTNLAQVVSSPTSVLAEPRPDSAVPINGDGQNHVESKDIQSTSSPLVLTEPVLNSLEPQFSRESVAAPGSASALREADTLHTRITSEEANGLPVPMDIRSTSSTLVLTEPVANSLEPQVSCESVPASGSASALREADTLHTRITSEEANGLPVPMDIGSTSSTLILTEPLANSLEPQFSRESVAAPGSASALRKADTLHTRITSEEANGLPVPMDYSLVSGITSNIVVRHEDSTRMSNVEQRCVEDANSCQTSNFSALSTAFHLRPCNSECNQTNLISSWNMVQGRAQGERPCNVETPVVVRHDDTTRISNLERGCVEDANSCQTSNISAFSSAFHLRHCPSESNQANLISSWNMAQERVQGEKPCNLEMPMVDREMHFSGYSVGPQGFHSVLSTETNLGVNQNSNDVFVGLQSVVNNPIKLSAYSNPKDVQSGHWNYFSGSEFSELERMRFAASGNVNMSNDLWKQTSEKGVIESDGSVDRISNLSGQKRRLADITPNLQNDISPKMSGIPRKKWNSDYIPNDDDLLASILVGRTPPAVRIGSTPPLPKPPSLKRPRLTAKAGLPKRRKVLLDDTIVLHADVIRQQLINTEDIRRIRKKAPCTRPEIWRIQKSSLEDDIFCEPIFTGVSDALNRLLTRTYDLAQNIHSQVNAHYSSGEASKEVEFSKSSVSRVNDGQEMATQNAVAPKGVVNEMQVAYAVAELIGVASHKNAVPIDVQEQLESPLELHHADLTHNTISRAELDVLGHSGIVPVAHVVSSSGIEQKRDDLCTDTDQNSLNKEFQTSQDLLEVNNNRIHAADGSSFEDFAPADCSGEAEIVSDNVAAAIDNETSLEGKDLSNAKTTTMIVEDMGVDVVEVNNNILHAADGTSFEDLAPAHCSGEAGVVSDNVAAAIDNLTSLDGKDLSNAKTTTMIVEDMGVDVVNLDCPQDGPANQGNDDCGGKLIIETGQDFPADHSTVIGSVDASVPGMVLAGNRPVTIDYRAMNDSEAGKITDEERPVSDLPGGESPPMNSFPVQPCTGSEGVNSVVGENSSLHKDGGLDVESNTMEFVATRESSDFCSAIDDIDTDFLNVDDDVDEYEEEANVDAPNTEEAQSLENSGWSSRTRGVARYLKNMFDQESGRGRKSVVIDHLLAGKTRKEASRMFFEALVLKTKDFIHVEQENPFDCINIKPRIKLLKSEF